MKTEIKVKSYYFSMYSISNTDEEINYFSDYENLKEFIKNRFELKNKRDILKIEIGEKTFVISLLGDDRLEKLKEHFFFLQTEKNEPENAEKEKENEDENSKNKTSKIEIRIGKKEKEEVLKKCKKLGLSISEYTRQLYEHGNTIIVPEQTQKDVRGMAINLNQIARRLNAGAVAPNTVIFELSELLQELNKSYNR